MPQSDPDSRDVASGAPKVPELNDFPKSGPNSLAAIGQRATARLLDLLVLAVPAVLMLVPFVRVEGEKVTTDVPTWLGLVALALVVVYETAMIAWRGQTVGKWVLGVRVARLTDGRTPAASQALMRILFPACFLAIPIPVVDTGWIVVYLSSMYNPMRRGWHDKAAGTIVIRSR